MRKSNPGLPLYTLPFYRYTHVSIPMIFSSISFPILPSSRIIHNLVVSLFLLGLLLEPIHFLLSRRTSLSLSLNLNSLCLVCFQLIRDIGLFGRLGGLGWSELLHVCVGIGGFNGGGFVCFQFFEVKVLDEIRCGGGLAQAQFTDKGVAGSSPELRKSIYPE